MDDTQKATPTIGTVIPTAPLAAPNVVGRSEGYTEAEMATVPAQLRDRYQRLNRVDRSGKDFTEAGKEVVKEVNKNINRGKVVCEGCKTETIPAEQHSPGVTPPNNEAHVDHIYRKRDNGRGNPDSGQVLCRNCNVVEKH